MARKEVRGDLSDLLEESSRTNFGPRSMEPPSGQTKSANRTFSKKIRIKMKLGEGNRVVLAY